MQLSDEICQCLLRSKEINSWFDIFLHVTHIALTNIVPLLHRRHSSQLPCRVRFSCGKRFRMSVLSLRLSMFLKPNLRFQAGAPPFPHESAFEQVAFIESLLRLSYCDFDGNRLWWTTMVASVVWFLFMDASGMWFLFGDEKHILGVWLYAGRAHRGLQ